ncbi:hypothetical protein H4R34_002374 [Dimargaris verticillata]|uniref:Ima1 N-terminal domain-containing protein n=1 Tax=Dimargaris verticillata TaxID=2761393 RepID=A0A9W8B9L2_9FUNG|nr:hypothetical protein H4R34_002374 [Dimargaris verticillata]
MLSSLWSPSKHRVCYYCNQLRSDSPTKPLKPKANLLRTPSQRGLGTFPTSSPPLTLGQYPIQWYCRRCESWNIWDERDQIVDAYNVLQLSGNLGDEAKPSLEKLCPRLSWKSDQGTSDVFSGDDSGDGQGSSPTPASKATSLTPAFEFCPACSQNQYIVMQALGDYIPDEDDPTYVGRVNSVEAYRQHMEQRYPPVCALCQPRVESQLLQCNRRLKDHLLHSTLRRSYQYKDTGKRFPRLRPTRLARCLWYTQALTWLLIWIGTNVYFYSLRATLAKSVCPIPPTIPNVPTIELGHLSFSGPYLETLWLPWDTLVTTVHEWQRPLQVDLLEAVYKWRYLLMVGMYSLLASLVALTFDPTRAYTVRRHTRSTAHLARFRRCQLGSIAVCLFSILVDQISSYWQLDGLVWAGTLWAMYNATFAMSLLTIRIRNPIKLNFPEGAGPTTSSTPGATPAYQASHLRPPSPASALSRQASAADTETTLSRLQLLGDDDESKAPQLVRTYTPPPRLDPSRQAVPPFATTRWEMPTPTPKSTTKAAHPTTLPFLRSASSGTSWSTQQPPPFNLNSRASFESQSPAPQARSVTPNGFGFSGSNRSLSTSSPSASLWRTPSALPTDWSLPLSSQAAAPVFPKRPRYATRSDSGQWFEPDRMTTTGSVTGLEDLFNETVRLADNFGITGSRAWLRQRWYTFSQWRRKACTLQNWQWWSSEDARWWSRWLALGLRTLTLNSLWARMMFLALIGYWTVVTTVSSCSWLFWSAIEMCGIMPKPSTRQQPVEPLASPARLFSAPSWSELKTPNMALASSQTPPANLSARRPKNHLHVVRDQPSTHPQSPRLRAWLTQGVYRMANYGLGLLSLTLAASLLIELAAYTQLSNSLWLAEEPCVAWRFWQHLELCQVSPPLDASSTSLTAAAPLDPNILAQSVLRLNYVLQALVYGLESHPASSLLAWLAYPIQLYLHATATMLWQPYYGAVCVWLHSRAIQSLVLLATVADFFWVFTL